MSINYVIIRKLIILDNSSAKFPAKILSRVTARGRQKWRAAWARSKTFFAFLHPIYTHTRFIRCACFLNLFELNELFIYISGARLDVFFLAKALNKSNARGVQKLFAYLFVKQLIYSASCPSHENRQPKKSRGGRTRVRRFKTERQRTARSKKKRTRAKALSLSLGALMLFA